jgi:hypothetical protein
MIEIHSEQITDGLKSFILNNLDTYLTQIETEQGDGIDLPMVNENDVYLGVYSVENFRYYPVLLIQPDEGEYQYLSAGHQQFNGNFVIWFLIKGYDETQQTTMMQRYEAAFRELFLSDRTIGGTTDEVNVTNYRIIGKINNEEINGLRMNLVCSKEVSM